MSEFVAYLIDKKTNKQLPLEGRDVTYGLAAQDILKKFKKIYGGGKRRQGAAADKYDLEVYEVTPQVTLD